MATQCHKFVHLRRACSIRPKDGSPQGNQVKALEPLVRKPNRSARGNSLEGGQMPVFALMVFGHCHGSL